MICIKKINNKLLYSQKYWYEVTSFSVTICMKQMKILCGQLNCLVKLADISTRCSCHPQGNSEARCENAGVLIGVVTALAHPCGSVQRLKCWRN